MARSENRSAIFGGGAESPDGRDRPGIAERSSPNSRHWIAARSRRRINTGGSRHFRDIVEGVLGEQILIDQRSTETLAAEGWPPQAHRRPSCARNLRRRLNCANAPTPARHRVGICRHRRLFDREEAGMITPCSTDWRARRAPKSSGADARLDYVRADAPVHNVRMNRPSEDDPIARYFAPLARPGARPEGRRGVARPAAGKRDRAHRRRPSWRACISSPTIRRTPSRRRRCVNVSGSRRERRRAARLPPDARLPRDWRAEWLESFARGLARTARFGLSAARRRHGFDVWPMTLSVTARSAVPQDVWSGTGAGRRCVGVSGRLSAMRALGPWRAGDHGWRWQIFPIDRYPAAAASERLRRRCWRMHPGRWTCRMVSSAT